MQILHVNHSKRELIVYLYFVSVILYYDGDYNSVCLRLLLCFSSCLICNTLVWRLLAI
uniref:Uncharacterized protein n=1 Tax=Arundo donax TaxID=35708 RepID=A0A0A9FBB1_ARUDO